MTAWKKPTEDQKAFQRPSYGKVQGSNMELQLL